MGRSSGATLIPQQQLIVNGDYGVFQRGSGNRSIPTGWSDAVFHADRMYSLAAGAGTAFTSPEGNLSHCGPRSSGGIIMTGATSVTTVDHGQIIANRKVGRYKTPLLFSCAIFNPGTTFTPKLFVDTPSAVDQLAARTWTTRNGGGSGVSLQPAAGSGVITIVSATFDPSAYTNIANGLRVRLQLPSGVLDSGAKNVSISQFSLKPAAAYPLFVPEDPDDEWRRCIAYNEIIGGPTPSFSGICVGKVDSSTQATMFLPYARKQIIPSVGNLGAAADYALSNVAGSLVTVTSLSFSLPTFNGVNVIVGVASGISLGSATVLFFNNPSNEYIQINAELG